MFLQDSVISSLGLLACFLQGFPHKPCLRHNGISKNQIVLEGESPDKSGFQILVLSVSQMYKLSCWRNWMMGNYYRQPF